MRLAKAAVIGCVTGLAVGVGCGGDDQKAAPWSPTVAGLQKSHRYWQSRTINQQEALGRLCLKQAVTEASGLQREQLATVKPIDLIGAVDGYYSEPARSHRTIARACADVAREHVPQASIALEAATDASFGGVSHFSTPDDTFALRGTLDPKDAQLTIARALGDTTGTYEGWGRERTVEVRKGRFTIALQLHAGDHNNYRLSARSPTHRVGRELVGIKREPSEAELAARRQRREEQRQQQIATATVSYSGNGGKNIGSVKVPKDSTLYWTCDGDIFSVLDDDGDLFVNSQAHSGTTDAPAGTYTGVSVNAIGNWTITIKPND